MAYTDEIQVELILQRELTTREKASLSIIVPTIEKWLDKRLNSTFNEAVETTRYYDGGGSVINIDPCTAISSIASIDDSGTDSYTYTVGTEYIAEPQNETVKTEIRRRNGSFPYGIQRIAVTAIFSEYDEGVPADIRMIATKLAASLLMAGKLTSQGGVKSESLEGHSITYETATTSLEGIAETDPTVKSLLAQRKELYVDDYNNRPQNDYDDDGGLLI